MKELLPDANLKAELICAEIDMSLLEKTEVQ